MAARRTDAGSGDGGLGAEEVGTRRPDLTGPSGVVVGGGVGPTRGHVPFCGLLVVFSQTPVYYYRTRLAAFLMAAPSLSKMRGTKAS